MGRYDWPASSLASDDPFGRARHTARVYAAPDVRLPDGSLPPAMAMPESTTAARRRAKARPSAAPSTGPSAGAHLWLPLGPTAVVGGQASGRPRVAGRIRDLAVEPGAGQRLYAASGSGGVWFSGDRGISWRPLDEFSVSPNRETLFPIGNTLACGALHVVWGAPATGSADEVIVGTGEPGGGGQGTPGGHVSGVGILRAVGPATGAAWTFEAPQLRGQAIWRITEDPLNRQHQFAATTDGLYARPPAGAWAQVAGLALNPNVSAPWDAQVLDVAITRLASPNRLRIWVLGYGLLRVAEIVNPPAPPAPANLTGLVFQTIALPGVLTTTRLVLSAQPSGDVWVLGRRIRPKPEEIDPAHLWRVNAGVALGSLTATEITGVPGRLFMSAGDQSDYDMGLTLHPTDSNRLYLAGAAASIEDQWNGSLYRIDVAAAVATPTLIGKGVHSDCHIVRTAPSPNAPKNAIWVGCDGGVYLSDLDGDADSFVSRNTGLAVLQPGFVACHPTNDGIIAAGMQDNGTCERVGDTAWREPFLGDGGGVVYDPTHPNRYLRQYVQGNWESSDNTGVAPVFRRNRSAPTGQVTSEQYESSEAKFYTGAAAIAHRGTRHLAFGTNRVWYSSDWGESWVTLPTGTDPRAARNEDLAQDVLQVGAVPGQQTDPAQVDRSCSTENLVTHRTDNGVLTCRWAPMLDAPGHHRIRLCALWNRGIAIILGSRPGASTSDADWTWTTDETVPIRVPSATEQAAVDNGDRIAFLPGVGLVNDLGVHLPNRAAFGSFYVATVGSAGSGPGQEIDTLWWYDGDGHFVPCGLRRAHPRGAWSGTRIAAPALSVVVDPDDPAIVYVGTSVGVVRGDLTMVLNNGVDEPHWAWQNFDNGLPEGAVHDLSIFSHDGVKLLRAALQSRGVWETDLNAAAAPRTYLRVYATDGRRRRPTPLSGPATNGQSGVRWDASPDVVIDTTAFIWPASGPTEFDLFELPFAGRVGEFAAQSFATRQFRMHVLAHHRWSAPAAAADVKIALLRHDGPTNGDVPLGAIWTTLLAIAAGGAVPASLPGGWLAAGPQLLRPIGATVDARMPRSATFNVNLTGVPNGTRVTFLAVVMSAADPLTIAEAAKENASAVATVEELVRYSRHAAARTLRLTS